MDAWNAPQRGNPMFQVCERIKNCRASLLKLRMTHNMNSSKAILEIKKRMEVMQEEGRNRYWTKWNQLQRALEEEYKREKAYWHQKYKSSGSRRETRTLNFSIHMHYRGEK